MLAAAARWRAAQRVGRNGTGTRAAGELYTLAGAAAMSGERDSAVAWLTELAARPLGFSGARVALDPSVVSLRQHPRFRTLVGAVSP